jgi:hypothetical protein
MLHNEEIVMFPYNVYGYNLIEIEVNHHIKDRLFFAISIRDNPKWLAWYVYDQFVQSGQMVDEFLAAATADDTRIIGKTLDGTPPFALTYSDKVDVNEFANSVPLGNKATYSPSTLSVDAYGDTLRCRLDITRKAAATAHVVFDLVNEKNARNLVPNKGGTVRLLGWAGFSKDRPALGPFGLSHAWLKDFLEPSF